MPRQIFKRYMPNPEKLKSNPSLRFLGNLIHDPNLWHLNRHSVARAVAVGLFWAMLPIPMQMFAAAFLAIPLRANLPISVGLVWVTNPVTMPPIFYANYKLGAWLLGTPTLQLPDKITLSWILEVTTKHWQPLFTGSIVTGLLLAMTGYFATLLYWRWWVNRNWRKRNQLRNSRLND